MSTVTPRPHVVVVGDVVLDRDVDGRTDRLCPDAPVPVVDVTATRESPGGAGLTALLCAASGAHVTLVAPIGDDDAGRVLSEHLRRQVSLLPLPHEGATRLKMRIRSSGQSLVRVDEGGPGTPHDVPVEEVRALLATADVVVVSDYGAGVTRDPSLRGLLTEAARGRPVVWDPHPRGGAPVPGVTVVTPNLAEAQSSAADVAPEEPHLDAATGDVLATTLRAAWDVEAVCVTAGAAGAFLAVDGMEPLFVPATPAVGGDTCGAGDRFVATVALTVARGGLLSDAVGRAVQEASDWVADGGAEGFRRREELPAVEAVASAGIRTGADEVLSLAPTAGGPTSEAALQQLAAALRAGGRTLVATGGCFDIVHAGHVATLQAARRLGDALVVLVNSDESVGRLKGAGRPVVTAADRARVLEAFDCVDAVVVFDEDDPSTVLARLQPDVWAKGGDYSSTSLPEAEVVREHGGRVVLLPFLGGRSTTGILDRATTLSQVRSA